MKRPWTVLYECFNSSLVIDNFIGPLSSQKNLPIELVSFHLAFLFYSILYVMHDSLYPNSNNALNPNNAAKKNAKGNQRDPVKRETQTLKETVVPAVEMM